MSIFFTLIKTQLNLNFGISALKYRFTKEKKKRWEPILIAFAVVFGIAPLVLLYTLMLSGVFAAGLSLNQPEMVITVSFVFGQLIVFLFGIFYVMGAFYFSKDMDILIPLPLKPYQVLGSKFLVVMVNEYLTLLPILVPAIVIYGVGMGQGLLYWIKGVLLVLASPVIPLVAASLFIIILMRIINVRKSKDLLAIIGGFLILIITLSFNYFFQRVPKIGGDEYFKGIMESQAGLIEAIGQRFPPSIWATFGLSRPGFEGLGYFILFIGLSVLLFFVLLWLGNRIFYRAVISGQEVTRNRRTFTTKEMDMKYGRISNPVTAIFKKEWKLLLRTPVYVLNGLTGMVIGPFILVMMLFAPGQSEELRGLLDYFANPAYVIPITLVGLGIILFTAGMNIVASTAISREGQTFWIAKTIPVTPEKQIMGKLLHGFTISAVGVVVTSMVLALVFKFYIPRVIVLALLGLIGSVALVSLNLIIDVFRPKLVWNSPQEAMKQNLNGLFGMLVSVFVIAVFAGVSIILILLKTPEWLVYLILALLMCIMSVISLTGLFALAKRQYRKLEV